MFLLSRTGPATALLTSLLAGLAPGVGAQDGSSSTGHAVAKRFAELGEPPDPAAIVIEDIVNYHRHGIPLPKAGQEVALDLRWDAPFGSRSDASVLQIGLATARVHSPRDLTPIDVVLVIDTSGSMSAEDKMTWVKAGLERFVRKLRPDDRIAIVGYADAADVVLRLRDVGDGDRALSAIRSLQPGGSTNLHGGLMLGYEQLARDDGDHGDRGDRGDTGTERTASRRQRRVILLTDGIANKGVTDSAQIARDSRRCNERGIDLTTVGVGKDFNHELLARLAKAGHGLFHFVSDRQQVEKVFVDEAQSLSGAVARDVRLEVRHGRDIEVDEVFGYRPAMRRGGFSVPLDDLNHGLTSVVLAKVHRAADGGRDTWVKAALTWRSAGNGERRRVDLESAFLDPMDTLRAAGLIDHEVRKNFTIPVLARATHEVAELGKSSRYGEAERVAERALRFFRANYRDTDDVDLRQNHDVLEQYRRIVASRIERFRRL
ncbi:MAG: VWA domain-containing protein [Planctomycetes bacterium]|nr:VWA domain-containing protein [Planctomycetota bacterium]